MNIDNFNDWTNVILKDGTVRTVINWSNELSMVTNSDGNRYYISEIDRIIHEAELPTDGAPDWYRGKPVYCEASDDAKFSTNCAQGLCIFNGYCDYKFGILYNTKSGDIEDWDGGIVWCKYARPTTPPSKAKYFILKTVDGKEEKHELTIEQIQVLGLEE